MTAQRVQAIDARLREAFQPEALEIHDDSARHAGHASARGGGHFRVHIVSRAFAGKSRLDRHRLVYAALADLMPHDIHALSVKALAPDET